MPALPLPGCSLSLFLPLVWLHLPGSHPDRLSPLTPSRVPPLPSPPSLSLLSLPIPEPLLLQGDAGKPWFQTSTILSFPEDCPKCNS